MTTTVFDADTRYPITVQRSMLMLPMYVVMTARIRGRVPRETVSKALQQVRQRHFLLGTRVEFEADGAAYLKREGTAAFQLDEIVAEDENHWERVVRDQLRTPFDLQKGPLVRFSLVQSEAVSRLIVCAHHVICDGISLGFLVRDMLSICGSPDAKLQGLPMPPQITQATASMPLKINVIRRWIISRIRRVWAAKNIRFDQELHERMLNRFFEKNDAIQVSTVELSASETGNLVSRCRAEKVTVNSAIWGAFLEAQDKILPHSKIHSTAGLARSLRPFLRPEVHDSFGFFAGSMTFRLPYELRPSFWEMVRDVHRRIRRRLDAENPFQLLIMELVHPTLADSLYFQKLGFIDERLSRKMLKLAHWHKLYYGCAITNVGRLDIPEQYGPLTLEAINGPFVYSDVNEKTVGITTVADRLTISMTSNSQQVSEHDASKILLRVRDTLLDNCNATPLFS